MIGYHTHCLHTRGWLLASVLLSLEAHSVHGTLMRLLLFGAAGWRCVLCGELSSLGVGGIVCLGGAIYHVQAHAAPYLATWQSQ
jgi:hypothetical protein